MCAVWRRVRARADRRFFAGFYPVTRGVVGDGRAGSTRGGQVSFLSPIDRGFSSGRRCAPERRRPRGVAALERAVLTPRAHLAASNPPRAASSSADSASGLAALDRSPPRRSAGQCVAPGFDTARVGARGRSARRARGGVRARERRRARRDAGRPRRGSPRRPRRSRRRSSRSSRARGRGGRAGVDRDFALRGRGRHHRPRRRRPVGGAREQEGGGGEGGGQGDEEAVAARRASGGRERARARARRARRASPRVDRERRGEGRVTRGA